MGGQGNRALLALCWIWIAIVIAYMAWGLINQAGLFGWLAELQLRKWGSYQEKLTRYKRASQAARSRPTSSFRRR